MRWLRALMALSLLAACDPYETVKADGSIAAYEDYLKNYPTAPGSHAARIELEQLYLDEARADGTLASYDRYLSRFPRGHFHKKAIAEREDFMFKWALRQTTKEAWEQFKSEYPHADRKKLLQADQSLTLARYQGGFKVENARAERVNMAEDPDGPLNGWGFYADITNNGTARLQFVAVTMWFLDDSGKALDTVQWPLVAKDFGIPMPEEATTPMNAGETRTWDFMSNKVPEGWTTQKIDVKVTGLAYAE